MRRALVAVTLVGAMVLGGCGIPDNSDVQVLGPAPAAGPSAGDDRTPPEQFGRDATKDATTFVDYYLQAAAGDPETALTRVKSFLSPQAQAKFKPGSQDIKVIREVKKRLNQPGSTDFTLSVQQVGVLQANGQLTPSDPTTTELKLVIRMVPGKGLFVVDAPPVLLLSVTALDRFYEQHAIYFWNADYTGLVPDVRYMPLSIRTARQPTVILNWLGGGPADWLEGVHVLPQGTVTPDNVPAVTNDRLQISLGASAVQPPGDEKALDRLRRQLQWSLGRLVPRTLELRIGHQNPVSFTDGPDRDSYPAAQLVDVPERFAIMNGAIRRLVGTPQALDPVPVIKPEANRNIQAAAMAKGMSHTYAAVVTRSGKRTALRVAGAWNPQTADLHVVTGLSGPLGHPTWTINSSGGADSALGLITARGRLYSFGVNHTPAKPVEWQNGDPGPISAVSVAPDGRRVAVVAGGRLYRTMLRVGGDGVELAPPDQIWPATLRSVSAVAWSSEGWLVVAGVSAADHRVTVMDVSIDGARYYPRLDNLGTQPVTYITAYPLNPLSNGTSQSRGSNAISYVANGSSFNVLSEAVKITTADVVGPPLSPTAANTPTAPFFFD